MASERRITLFPNSQVQQQSLAAQSRTALRVEHLTKYFGEQRILDNINISVAEGESLVLLEQSVILREVADFELRHTGFAGDVEKGVRDWVLGGRAACERERQQGRRDKSAGDSNDMKHGVLFLVPFPSSWPSSLG